MVTLILTLMVTQTATVTLMATATLIFRSYALKIPNALTTTRATGSNAASMRDVSMASHPDARSAPDRSYATAGTTTATAS
jgi:hypothetical protein